MPRRLALIALLSALALLGAACGGDEADTGFPDETQTQTGEASPNETHVSSPDDGDAAGELTITAKNIKFDKAELTFKADTESTLTFDNQDAGVPHNVAIYKEKGGDEIFKGETFNGPGEREYKIPSTPAGTYYFHCDVHPNMNGAAKFE